MKRTVVDFSGFEDCWKQSKIYKIKVNKKVDFSTVQGFDLSGFMLSVGHMCIMMCVYTDVCL